MGTNFYLKHIPTRVEIEYAKEQFEKLADASIAYNEFIDLIDPIFNNEIHIGKRSAGWQFLWHYHPNLFEPNLESIKEWLNSPDSKIVDEYGDCFTVEEFLNDEIKDCLYSGHTLESYYKTHKDKFYSHSWIDHETVTKDGLRISEDDFS